MFCGGFAFQQRGKRQPECRRNPAQRRQARIALSRFDERQGRGADPGQPRQFVQIQAARETGLTKPVSDLDEELVVRAFQRCAPFTEFGKRWAAPRRKSTVLSKKIIHCCHMPGGTNFY